MAIVSFWHGHHFAAHEAKTNIVDFLLRQGVNTTAKNREGKTALDYAKEKKFDDIIALLEGYRSRFIIEIQRHLAVAKAVLPEVIQKSQWLNKISDAVADLQDADQVFRVLNNILKNTSDPEYVLAKEAFSPLRKKIIASMKHYNSEKQHKLFQQVEQTEKKEFPEDQSSLSAGLKRFHLHSDKREDVHFSENFSDETEKPKVATKK